MQDKNEQLYFNHNFKAQNKISSFFVLKNIWIEKTSVIYYLEAWNCYSTSCVNKQAKLRQMYQSFRILCI